MSERRYNLTFAELLDRLSIVQLKAIRTPYKEQYEGERVDIEHDLDLLMKDRSFTAYDIRCFMLLMHVNTVIWDNESFVREGKNLGVAETAQRLRFTHTLNGVRNQIKNVLNVPFDQRQEAKADCLASDLPEELGNWSVL
jgi:hypothetical protein